MVPFIELGKTTVGTDLEENQDFCMNMLSFQRASPVGSWLNIVSLDELISCTETMEPVRFPRERQREKRGPSTEPYGAQQLRGCTKKKRE